MNQGRGQECRKWSK